MLYHFRKISTRDAIFIETKQYHEFIYNDFKNYAEYLTLQRGKVTKGSNKAGSYANYLIRMIIFYNEQASEPLNDLLHNDTLLQLEAMKQAPNFKSFNQQENRFPSASINCFLDYATHKMHEQLEELQDYHLNEDIWSVQEEQVLYITQSELQPPGPRKEKVVGAFGESYPRSLLESTTAKINSQWKCEYDPSHTTFISKNGHPYVEAYHLIPMAQQDFFELNIDIASNIVALCPTCHRNIHFGQTEAKKQMLQKLFNDRLATYKALEIPITFQQLLAFYYIFE
jgi:5-methylcytosine-specific restriction enzyme A